MRTTTGRFTPMHELSITESLVAAILERVEGRIQTVTLMVGRLSGVVGESVRFCFDVCTQGTRLEGAALDIIDIPGRVRCLTCDVELELPDTILLCTCGSANVDIVGGQELRIKNVEVMV
ncbi:MAG: hydrogenase maturation nickel metallochaperone HypA [Actinomycetota bacterium]|nr:hydrogenase maturation nickel metallochaperone HypA [Actinomycetota bacterium]